MLLACCMLVRPLTELQCVAAATQVGPPQVITKIDPTTGGKMEPMEEAVVEVPEEHVGQVVDLMGQRKAQMVDMTPGARLRSPVPRLANAPRQSAPLLAATKAESGRRAFSGKFSLICSTCAGSDGTTRIKYEIPTRALLGIRNAMLTATKGTAVLNTVVTGYTPYVGEIQTRENGSLVGFETGQVGGAMERVNIFCRR